MPAEKLLAEWFWIDRWIGSSAFLLPQEARGVYREMLTQAWRRGARLPNDHEAIRRATGTTKREWLRAWPLIERYWRVEGDSLVNDTQLEVYASSLALTEARSRAGKLGNEARWGRKPHRKHVASDIAIPVANTSPPNSVSVSVSDPVPSEPKNGGRLTARSKRPIFSGQRLTVFEWMLDDLSKLLGAYFEDFDCHTWFFTLDARAVEAGMVIPQRDGGAWLQGETLLEAQRRGLPIALAHAAPKPGSLSARMAALVANSRSETS